MKKHDKTTCKIDTTPQLYEGEDLVIKSTSQLFLVMDVTVISIFF
jgi:CheY-specific phosphatase CheX